MKWGVGQRHTIHIRFAMSIRVDEATRDIIQGARAGQTVRVHDTAKMIKRPTILLRDTAKMKRDTAKVKSFTLEIPIMCIR